MQSAELRELTASEELTLEQEYAMQRERPSIFSRLLPIKPGTQRDMEVNRKLAGGRRQCVAIFIAVILPCLTALLPPVSYRTYIYHPCPFSGAHTERRRDHKRGYQSSPDDRRRESLLQKLARGPRIRSRVRGHDSWSVLRHSCLSSLVNEHVIARLPFTPKSLHIPSRARIPRSTTRPRGARLAIVLRVRQARRSGGVLRGPHRCGQCAEHRVVFGPWIQSRPDYFRI